MKPVLKKTDNHAIKLHKPKGNKKFFLTFRLLDQNHYFNNKTNPRSAKILKTKHN